MMYTLLTRGGKSYRKRAVISVARKLSVLLHRLIVTGEVYDPLRNCDLSLPDVQQTERFEERYLKVKFCRVSVTALYPELRF